MENEVLITRDKPRGHGRLLASTKARANAQNRHQYSDPNHYQKSRRIGRLSKHIIKFDVVDKTCLHGTRLY